MRRWFASGGLALMMFAVSSACLADIGTVISLNPGARAEQSGQSRELRLKDGVQLADTILTDATGRTQIVFSDDSTVTVGKSSSLSLNEFADSGGSSHFGAHLTQGVARFITGKVVERNPKGFTVTTPEATVGIRGTIFTVLTVNGQTTVFVENTVRREVYVNDILVPQGFKITLPSTKRLPEPMTEQDKEFIELATTINRDRARTLEEGPMVAANDLTDVNLPMQYVSQTLMPGATVSGSLASVVAIPGFSGQFSFNVDLGSGQISNASLAGSGIVAAMPFSYSGSGGTGLASGGAFTITGFQGPASLNGVPGSINPDPLLTKMSGSGDMSAVGNPVSGNYDINAFIFGTIDTGTFAGSRTQ